MHIPLISNTFFNNQETKEALAKFIKRTDRFSMGPRCEEFELKFAQYQGRKHAVLFNSGSSANLAIIQALKNLGVFKNNKKILHSATTWATNIMPSIQLGLTPIIVDINLQTLNSMASDIKGALKGHKIAVMFVTNVLGFAGDLWHIKNLCDEHNVLLIEDNCEGLGTEVNHIRTGNFGEAATFSFYVAHHLSTIEGGMVVTDSTLLMNSLKMIRAHGWARNLSTSTQKELENIWNVNSNQSPYTFYELGYNLRPTEITGFLGSHQLDLIYTIQYHRLKNFRIIQVSANKNKDITPIDTNHLTKVHPFGYPLILKSKRLRDKYLKKFKKLNIETRSIVVGNITKQPFYKALKYTTYDNLYDSDLLEDLGFYFTIRPNLTKEEIDYLIEAVS